VHRLLHDAGRDMTSIDCLAVLSGPGSYTGLRTGLAFVRGLALVDDLPVAPVSALERLAFFTGAEGEKVIATWQGSAGLVVAGAYQVCDGLPLEIIAGGAFDAGALEGFIAHCIRVEPGPWVLAIERTQEDIPAVRARFAGVERRVVDSQHVEAVARIGYARHVGGLGVGADNVVPDYVGTSEPRINRNRVAAPFARVTH